MSAFVIQEQQGWRLKYLAVQEVLWMNCLAFCSRIKVIMVCNRQCTIILKLILESSPVHPHWERIVWSNVSLEETRHH